MPEQTPDRRRIYTASSDDNVLSFRVAARAGGVSVERTEQRTDGRRIVQSMHFAEEAQFVQWCQSDDLRFAYPLLFANLTRSGCELFDANS